VAFVFNAGMSEHGAIDDTLRESGSFAYSTLDALVEHIAVLDEAGAVIAVNRTWREFATANARSLLNLCEGANYLDVCDRAAREGSRDGAAFADGIRAVVSGERSEFSLEYPCDSPGERRWFVGRVTRFQSEGSIRVVVSHANVTARKEAEQKLRQSEEWLRAIFEASRDGILVEGDERIVYVNRAYTRLFGYEDSAELCGRHISAVISPDDQEQLLNYGRRRVAGETPPAIFEFKGRRKDGALIDLEASVSTSNVAGRDFITTAIRDIAERKQAEAALREARDELERRVKERTAELAHINDALQAEVAEHNRAEESRTELLRRLVTAQEDERRRIARELHDQLGQHLTAVMLGVRSLKDSCRWEPQAEAHFKHLQELSNQLVHMVDTLAWELRPAALDDLGLYTALGNYFEKWTERSRVAVDFHGASLDGRRLPPHVETALYRIIQEALTNVSKHAGAEGVSIILGLSSDHVFAIVEDNGCGFDVEAVMNAPDGRRRLGLLGMRERVALVGGTLNVESTPHAGTSLFVRIPARPAEN
jgi:PAS domain S-box-containing protein